MNISERLTNSSESSGQTTDFKRHAPYSISDFNATTNKKVNTGFSYNWKFGATVKKSLEFQNKDQGAEVSEFSLF